MYDVLLQVCLAIAHYSHPADPQLLFGLNTSESDTMDQQVGKYSCGRDSKLFALVPQELPN